MDYYDPAEHEPLYVDCGPSIDRPRRTTAAERRETDLSIHSKHVWFGQWQDKTMSLMRPPEGR